MKTISVIFLSCLLLTACTIDSGKPGKITITPGKKTAVTPSDSGTIELNMEEGTGNITISKNEGQAVHIKFISNGYSKITAHLSSQDSLANVRFTQIVLPDGTMDGPFGRDLEYNLPVIGYL